MKPDKQASPTNSNSFFKTVKAVAWSFLGLRRKGDFESDISQLKPLHIVAVGLIGCFVFVGAIIIVVKLVVLKS